MPITKYTGNFNRIYYKLNPLPQVKTLEAALEATRPNRAALIVIPDASSRDDSDSASRSLGPARLLFLSPNASILFLVRKAPVNHLLSREAAIRE